MPRPWSFSVTSQYKTDGSDALYSPVELRIRGGICDPGIDTDCDLAADEVDNCPDIANLDQADSGGLLVPVADGIGDACQCGDLSRNGVIEALDLDLLRQALADPVDAALSPEALATCGVYGSRACDIVAATVLARALGGYGAPGIAPVCTASRGSG